MVTVPEFLRYETVLLSFVFAQIISEKSLLLFGKVTNATLEWVFLCSF